jgi:hypothetical protein
MPSKRYRLPQVAFFQGFRRWSGATPSEWRGAIPPAMIVVEERGERIERSLRGALT